MILADVRAYLAERGRAPLSDLCARFDVEADALRAMLQVWERKGRVRRLEPGTPCGCCCTCSEANPEIYEWLERG
jgi:hypothetical protein